MRCDNHWWSLGEGTYHFRRGDDLRKGDVILKGTNALDLSRMQAAIYIGDLHGETIVAALQAVVERWVQLIHPVDVEKRIPRDLNELAQKLNVPEHVIHVYYLSQARYSRKLK